MFYIWVKYQGTSDFIPHMTFTKRDKEAAHFEIDDLKCGGHKAKFGPVFP